jgi:sugar lactone lactonase YvrE
MSRKSSKDSLLAGALIALCLQSPARAVAGDTVADHVLGQRRFGTAFPASVDGTLLDAADLAIDRSSEPNKVYVASPDLNRVLGWSDIGRFRTGKPADLVLGQPSVFNGVEVPSRVGCPPPSATSLCHPTRVAVDPGGNLYVADSWNYRVLEFNRPFATDRAADRVLGQRGLTARRVPAAILDDWVDVAVDAQGNVWVLDPAGTRRILEYDAPLTHDTRPDRVIEPAAPSGSCRTGPQDPPCLPFGLAVSPRGDLYVQDRTPGGVIRGLIFQRPLATDLRPDFTLPPVTLAGGIAAPDGVFDAAGGLLVIVGRNVWRYPPPLGPGTAPEAVSPVLTAAFGGRLALDSRGNLYTATYPGSIEESSVHVLDAPFQASQQRIDGDLPFIRGLALPTIVAVDRSSSPHHLYVVDVYNRVLAWRDAEGLANGAIPDMIFAGDDLSSASTPSRCRGASEALFCPYGAFNRGGLAVDSLGNLWMADVDNHRVLEFDRPFENGPVADRVLGQGGSFTSRTCNLGGLSARSLCFPGAVALDAQGRLYVADLANHRVLLFEHPLTDDAASKVFGQPGFTQGSCNQGRSRPGAATLCLGEIESESNPHFVGASSLAVDPQGNLYVADTENTRVLVYRDPVSSDAVADVVIGQDGFRQTLRGTGARRFAFGWLAVAVGPSGELYVADPGNDRVLEFRNPLRDTTADRVFGHADFTTGGFPYPNYYYLPPPPTAANLLEPMGVAVDAEGNLFVADTAYDRVLEYDRP